MLCQSLIHLIKRYEFKLNKTLQLSNREIDIDLNLYTLFDRQIDTQT